METLPMSRGYLIAPILVSSLHVLFTPLWAVLGGQAGHVLATGCLVWSDRCLSCDVQPSALGRPQKHCGLASQGVKKFQKLMIAVIAAVFASFFIMGPYPTFRSTPVSWVCGYISAACFLSVLCQFDSIIII